MTIAKNKRNEFEMIEMFVLAERQILETGCHEMKRFSNNLLKNY